VYTYYLTFFSLFRFVGTTSETVTVTCSTGYSGGGTATCGTNGQFNTLICTKNICTCPNGTPSVYDGNAATLCDTKSQVDCSDCSTGYTLSEVAAAGTTSTCNANTCTPTQVANSDKAMANSISGMS